MKNSTTFIAFITALSLHLIVGAVMLLGLDFNFLKDKPKQEAVVINASMVNQKLFDDLAEKRSQQKADTVAAEKRKVEQERQEQARIKREKDLAEQKLKQVEEKRIQEQKAEEVRIEKEKAKEEERILFEEIVAAKEKRAKEEAKKAKEVADAKRKKLEEERVQQQIEDKKRIEAEKLKAEKVLKEKLAKEAKEAKIKAEKEEKAKQAKLKAEKEEKARKAAQQKAERLRQAELDKQMQEGFEDSSSSARSSKQLSEITRYQALIRDKISRNWQIDSSMKGKSCTLTIRLAPDGLVLSVSDGKGEAKLCDSAKRATFKAKILPIPKDPEISTQFREFDITLAPEL